MSVPDPLEHLTIGRVAALLSCSERHVHHLVASGQLPSTRIGSARGLRIRRVDLDQYVSRHTGYHVDPKHSARMKRVWLEQGVDGHLKAAKRRRSA